MSTDQLPATALATALSAAKEIASQYFHKSAQEKEQIFAAIIARHQSDASAAQAATIARLREQIENQASIIRDSSTPANEREARMLLELGQLRAKLTAYQQAADAVLSAWKSKELWGHQNFHPLKMALQQLAAAHRTATAHDGEREKGEAP